jgi:hypothetical protein
MFLGMMALVAILTVPVAGGRLLKLAYFRFRALPLLFLALLVQVLMTDLVSAPPRLLAAAHVASYVAAAVVIWLNREIGGLVVLGVGAGLNAVTIALNDGTLPASATALRSAGIVEDRRFENSAVLAHPRLGFLGDTMSTPSWLPFRNVLSVGDVVILVGLFVMLHVVCGSRLGVLLHAAWLRLRHLPLRARGPLGPVTPDGRDTALDAGLHQRVVPARDEPVNVALEEEPQDRVEGVERLPEMHPRATVAEVL